MKKIPAPIAQLFVPDLPPASEPVLFLPIHPFSYRGELPNVNFFLFENINNDYFVLCGISGLLFHSPGLPFGSEFPEGFWRPSSNLQLAEIMFETSTQWGFTASPNLEFSLWAASICQSLVFLEYLAVHILLRDRAPTSAKASNGSGLSAASCFKTYSQSPFS